MKVNGQLHATATLLSGMCPDIHWIGGRVGPRAGLNAVAKKENPSPCRESNIGRRTCGLVIVLTELPGLLAEKILY
jgi:hypothetical protein